MLAATASTRPRNLQPLLINMLAFLTGAGLGASLIIAIGAQNAFVLGQALRRDHALTVALTCSLVDAVLIALGVWGLGAFIDTRPGLLTGITLAGALFLFLYGAIAFNRARRPVGLDSRRSNNLSGPGGAVAASLALSLLNPHVYLDTVLLLGGIGGRLPGREPLLFAAGASFASFAWFFSLAIGGRLLAPWLAHPRHWQRLDILIGAIMWLIAVSLPYSLTDH